MLNIMFCSVINLSILSFFFSTERVIDSILTVTKNYGLGEELDRWISPLTQIEKKSVCCVFPFLVVLISDSFAVQSSL